MSEALSQQVLRETEKDRTVIVLSSNAEAMHMLITALNWKVAGNEEYSTVILGVPSWDDQGETYWYNLTTLGTIMPWNSTDFLHEWPHRL